MYRCLCQYYACIYIFHVRLLLSFQFTHSACKDAITEQRVAIKKVPKAFDDVVDAKRVSREIKLLRFMNHENVCLPLFLNLKITWLLC